MPACMRSRWWRTSTPRPSGPCTPGCSAPTPTSPPRSPCSGPMPCADDFHARHQALARRYLYRILDRRVRPALERERVCWIAARARCRAHARGGAGAGRAPRFLRVPRRRMPVADAHAQAHGASRSSATGPTSTSEVRANAFLHHMVRNIAGSLILVGRGERTGDWLAGGPARPRPARGGPDGAAAGAVFRRRRLPRRLRPAIG